MNAWQAGGRLVVLLAICALAVLPAALPVRAQEARTADIPASCRELAVNGGFEQVGQGWTQAANPPGRLLVTDFYWKSGQYAAELGGVNGATDRLSQAIVLPADVNQVTLTHWWALQTEEAGGAFDRLNVELYEPDGITRVAALLTVDNTAADSWAWNAATSNLSPYIGRSLLLRFTASTDDSRPTRFFVDDISIQGCVRRRVYLPLVWR